MFLTYLFVNDLSFRYHRCNILIRQLKEQVYEIVGSEYCRAQGLDFNDDVYNGDHEGIYQWAYCTAEDIDSYKNMKQLEDEIRQLVQQDIDNLEHDPREESDEDSDEAE
jgi:hypothetical protein